MNVVYVSPHFPTSFHPFCKHLRKLGANVLGLADEPYETLGSELKWALTEYYRVADMQRYEQMLRACGHFTHRHGKIDRIESHNEHWLETDARLRTDFNVPGPQADTVQSFKRKSEMKRLFQAAGVRVARGRIVRDRAECLRFIDEVGYPVVAKPDVGVGAAGTYKLRGAADLDRFLAERPAVDYIMEELVRGTLVSFDGLAGRDGTLVFSTSHVFSQGIMEILHADADLSYHSLRQVPADLEEAGGQIARAFGVKERFFHFEFFRQPDGALVALEVNLRPPGGLSVDMMNYANDIDLYREWANVVVNDRFEAQPSRSHHCVYIGRKSAYRYALPHEEVLARFRGNIVHWQPMSGVFAPVLGNVGYLARHAELQPLHEMVAAVQQRA
jgi:biotin carboxylase